MSKIAVCLSGRARLARRSMEFVRGLADNYVTMVFMHFWEESPSIRNQSWSKALIADSDIMLLRKHAGQSNRFRYMQERFCVLEHKFEEYRKTIKSEAFFNRWDVGIISMYYSMNQADVMRQEYEQATSTKFNCVIRARFDSEPQKPFNLYEYNMDFLHIPSPEYDCGGINDRFAFGGSEVMSTYSSVVHHIKEYAEKVGYQPEAILKSHLMKNHLCHDRIKRPDYLVLT